MARSTLAADRLRRAAAACAVALPLAVWFAGPALGAAGNDKPSVGSESSAPATPTSEQPSPLAQPAPPEQPPHGQEALPDPVLVPGSPEVLVCPSQEAPAAVDPAAALPGTPLDTAALKPAAPVTLGQPMRLVQPPSEPGGAPAELRVVPPVDLHAPVLVLDPVGATSHNGGLVLLTSVPPGLATSGPVTAFSPQAQGGAQPDAYTVLVFDPPRQVAFGSNLTMQRPSRVVAASGWVSGPVRGLVIPRATAAVAPPASGEQAPPASADRRRPRRERRTRDQGRSSRPSRGGQAKKPTSTGGAPVGAPAPVSDAASSAPAGPQPQADGPPAPANRRATRREKPRESAPRTIIRHVSDAVNVIPPAIKLLLGALGAAALAFGTAAVVAAARARRAHRQGERLRSDKSLLEEAIGSGLPERTPGLAVSVASRAAEGPASGGDFYELVALDRGRTAFVVGDISGHDRQAVVAATQVRKALRAYLLAGLEPRQVIQVATHAQVDQLGEHFATVTVAVYEPVERELVYALAGHPPPLTTEGPLPTPRPVCPPIGVALGAEVHQETVRLECGRPILLHTDGLSEARTRGLGMLGRDGLAGLLREFPDADELTNRVREIGGSEDDMLACIVVPVTDTPMADAMKRTPLTVSNK